MAALPVIALVLVAQINLAACAAGKGASNDLLRPHTLSTVAKAASSEGQATRKASNQHNSILSFLLRPFRAYEALALAIGHKTHLLSTKSLTQAPKDDDTAIEEAVEEHAEEGIAGAIFEILVVLVAAAVYKMHYASELVADGVDMEQADFSHGNFACMDNPTLSLYTCCVLQVVSSDNLNALGLLSFWLAIGMWIGLMALVTCGVPWLLIALVFVYFRQKMRTKLNLKNDTGTMGCDWLMWSFCCCCAAVQEAREIEKAPKASPKTDEAGEKEEVKV